MPGPQVHPGFKLFVGNIPTHVTEDEIKAHFSVILPDGTEPPQPEVVMLAKKGATTGTSCCFVIFETLEAAQYALDQRKDTKIVEDAKEPLNVNFAKGDKNSPSATAEPKMFVGSLSASITSDQVKEKFEEFGPVASVFVLDGSRSQSGEQSAIVQMETHRDMQTAMKELHETFVFPGTEKPITVRPARQKVDKGKGKGPTTGAAAKLRTSRRQFYQGVSFPTREFRFSF
jgi:RNA recognition motif-containing protein